MVEIKYKNGSQVEDREEAHRIWLDQFVKDNRGNTGILQLVAECELRRKCNRAIDTSHPPIDYQI